MNEKYFLDAIKDETLAKLIDETITLEKNAKNKNIKSNVFKIIAAAAAVVLVIGFFNIMPALLNPDADDINPGNSAGEITRNEDEYMPVADRGELFLPEKIEKSFFEDKILAKITDEKAIEKIQIYYILKDSVYNLTPDISRREKELLLDYLYEYTNITHNDMMQMCVDNGISLPKTVDPAYSHVRFGDDENTLLLEIEWHTYDTYLEEVLKPEMEKYNITDEEYEKEYLELIKDGKLYLPRLINGKEPLYRFSVINSYYDNNCVWTTDVLDMSKYYDKDGYYMFNVYPYYPSIIFFDEEINDFRMYGERRGNGVISPVINSKHEYDIFINEVIQIFDDQLARGVITQSFYDNAHGLIREIIEDPLECYIDMWFN